MHPDPNAALVGMWLAARTDEGGRGAASSATAHAAELGAARAARPAGGVSRTTGSGTGAFDHGARSRFNAWFFRAFDRYINVVARVHKDRAFTGLEEAGRVVEIGSGVGANLDRLARGAELIAIEPNLRMHDQLQARAAAAGVDLTLVAAGAESIPLPDASVDEVIASLVLCTVRDPAEVLAEVRRILRPGGRFRFVEHVAAPRWSPRRLLQRAIRRPWGWVYEGCDPMPDTPQRVRAAGFSEVRVEHRRLRRSAFVPVNTAVWGVAVR